MKNTRKTSTWGWLLLLFVLIAQPNTAFSTPLLIDFNEFDTANSELEGLSVYAGTALDPNYLGYIWGASYDFTGPIPSYVSGGYTPWRTSIESNPPFAPGPLNADRSFAWGLVAPRYLEILFPEATNFTSLLVAKLSPTLGDLNASTIELIPLDIYGNPIIDPLNPNPFVNLTPHFQSINANANFEGIYGLRIEANEDTRFFAVDDILLEVNLNVNFNDNPAVPEPSTFALLGLGLGAIALGNRRKRK